MYAIRSYYAHAHRVLHGAFHRTAERHTTLQLLADRLGHQLRVQLGLAHFNDVEVQFRIGEVRQFLAQGFDIGAFFAVITSYSIHYTKLYDIGQFMKFHVAIS